MISKRLLLLVWLALGNVLEAQNDFGSVREILEEGVENGSVVGGALLVLHHGEVVLKTGFGYAERSSKTGFPADAPCVIASISKPVLATAIYHLAESGKVEMDAPIVRYLPEFSKVRLESGDPLQRSPTVQELFTHTSGLRNDSAKGGRPWFAEWTRDQPISEVVRKYAVEFPFKRQPGTKSSYSGIGTDVAAAVAESAAGMTRNELLIRHLCEPLGLTGTFYRDAVALKKVGPMPVKYSLKKDGKLVVVRERHVPIENAYSSSGGSIISNVDDLAKWLLMFRAAGRHEGQPYLKEETVAAMLTPAPIGPNVNGGFFVRRKSEKGEVLAVGHTGSTGTNCWIDFEHDVIGIMLTQTAGSKEFRIAVEREVMKACSLNYDK